MANHSSILAWKFSWTEELDRLWSIGLQRVGHNLAHVHIGSAGVIWIFVCVHVCLSRCKHGPWLPW